MAEIERQIFTTKQAAEYLGVSSSWLEISRSKKNSNSPPYVKFAHLVRYRRSDLDAWLAERVVTHQRGGTGE